MANNVIKKIYPLTIILSDNAYNNGIYQMDIRFTKGLYQALLTRIYLSKSSPLRFAAAVAE